VHVSINGKAKWPFQSGGTLLFKRKKKWVITVMEYLSEIKNKE
jgi:hypothetical protein